MYIYQLHEIGDYRVTIGKLLNTFGSEHFAIESIRQHYVGYNNQPQIKIDKKEEGRTTINVIMSPDCVAEHIGDSVENCEELTEEFILLRHQVHCNVMELPIV